MLPMRQHLMDIDVYYNQLVETKVGFERFTIIIIADGKVVAITSSDLSFLFLNPLGLGIREKLYSIASSDSVGFPRIPQSPITTKENSR